MNNIQEKIYSGQIINDEDFLKFLVDEGYE